MQCIFCNSEQLFTINTRTTLKNTVWRRRRCESCHKTFTTSEKVDMSHLKVIKKDGSVRKFNHQKIFCGIYNAVREVKNMDRGKATVIAQNLQDEVEKKLWGANEKIESKKISVVVLEVLLDRAPNVFLTYLAYVNRMKLSKQTEQFSNKYWKSLIKKAVD